ncbi:hypothetical protein THAOC_37076, partial [Thalassiosira oceanica]
MLSAAALLSCERKPFASGLPGQSGLARRHGAMRCDDDDDLAMTQDTEKAAAAMAAMAVVRSYADTASGDRIEQRNGRVHRTRSEAQANMYHRVQRLLLATLIGSSAVPIAAQKDSILDIVKSNPEFSTLETVLVAADLDDVLDDDDESVTVFAPPNSAFNDLPQPLVTKLLDAKWKPQLQDVLGYHLVQGKVFSDDLTDGLALTGN